MLNQTKVDRQLFYKTNAFLCLLLWLVVVSCGPAGITPTPPTTGNTPAPSDTGYPPPAPTMAPQEAYPVPEEPTGIPLLLDKPIIVGAETVSGVGPPGLTVYIMNVTFMGEQMGTAVVDDNGRFAVSVEPVQAGIRIGLTADVATIGLTEEDILPGDGEISTPQVGYFYDSAVTSQN